MMFASNSTGRLALARLILFSSFLFALCSAGIGADPVRQFVVGGHSMVPTLLPGTRIEVDAGYYESAPIQRGDLIALKLNNQLMVKRVIAMERDEVAIRDGDLWLNGGLLDEPYLESPRKLSRKASRLLELQLERYGQRIPKGHLIAMGDNVNSSFDSEDFGLISYRQVVGKVVASIKSNP